MMLRTLGQTESRAVSALIPYERNARVHPEAQLAQIEASIREWGWTFPILVDEADRVIAGHGRLIVAKRLGLAEVSVLVARGWSEQQIRAYVIADNKIPEGATWDATLLTAEMLDLQASAFDVALTGFNTDELLRLVSGPAPAAARKPARRRSRGGLPVEATGATLDEQIAEIEETLGRPVDRASWAPSVRPEQAMPIIWREQVDLRCKPGADGAPDMWTGNAPGFLKETHAEPLVAGLRAVLAKHRAAA